MFVSMGSVLTLDVLSPSLSLSLMWSDGNLPEGKHAMSNTGSAHRSDKKQLNERDKMWHVVL